MKHRIAVMDEVKATMGETKVKTQELHTEESKARDMRCAIQNVEERTNIRDKEVSAIEKKSALTSKKCTGTITLSATGKAAWNRPWCLGSYEATEEEHEGAPVYRKSGKSDDYYLYRRSDGTWRADWKIGGRGGIKSVDTTADCPARVSQWQYYDHPYDGVWRSGDITVQCSVHTQ